jgi:subtilisin-like proprotein convertase family protein
VKADDHQAAVFGFLGVVSLLPVADEDALGNLRLRGFPAEAFIPDGTPQRPQGAFIFGIAPKPLTVRRVVVTNTISHQLMGDLLGSFSHGREVVVLNNHSPNEAVANLSYIYDDSDEKNIPGARPSDGPGSLMIFGGQPGVGQWMLTEVDNSPDHVGTNHSLFVFLEKQQDLTNGVDATIEAGGCRTDFVTVPLEGTNLNVRAALIEGTGPVSMQVCRLDDEEPCPPPLDVSIAGTTIVIDNTSIPPLNPGVYSVRLCNQGTTAVTVNIRARVLLDLEGVTPIQFTSGMVTPIKDDAVTYTTQILTNTERIARLDVGLRVNHPRISDLAFTLISPSGTRVLLMENRGGTSTAGLGYDTLQTNVVTVSADGGWEAQTNVINTGQTAGELAIGYDFFSLPDEMHVYYENQLIFNSGQVTNSGTFNIPYGPGASTSVTIIMNEGSTQDTNTAWIYTLTTSYAKYAPTIFTEDTKSTLTPIKFAVPPFTVPNYIGSNEFLVDQIFYLPETSLEKIVGQRAAGEWQLEILIVGPEMSLLSRSCLAGSLAWYSKARRRADAARARHSGDQQRSAGNDPAACGRRAAVGDLCHKLADLGIRTGQHVVQPKWTGSPAFRRHTPVGFYERSGHAVGPVGNTLARAGRALFPGYPEHKHQPGHHRAAGEFRRDPAYQPCARYQHD